MRARSVWGLICSSLAAPRGPSTRPCVTRSAASIAKVTTWTLDGQDVLVDLSLDDYQRLQLTEDRQVFIYPKNARVFFPKYEI